MGSYGIFRKSQKVSARSFEYRDWCVVVCMIWCHEASENRDAEQMAELNMPAVKICRPEQMAKPNMPAVQRCRAEQITEMRMI